MSNPETMMFVSVPGAEDVTEMPKSEVKRKMQTGDLPAEAVVWSQKNNEWKSPNAISSLIESPAAAPQPPVAAVPQTGAMPKIKATPAAGTAKAKASAVPEVSAAPKISAAPKAGASPRPLVKSKPAQVSGRAATSQLQAHNNAVAQAVHQLEAEKERRNSGWIKWVCAFVGVIVIGLLLFNWFYVNVPLQDNLAKSRFSQSSVYGHLGGFFQANTIAIHVFDAPDVTSSNFPRFITELAASTPHPERWEFVSLTSGWMAEYYVTGEDWRKLAKLTGGDGEEVRQLCIEILRTKSGSPLMPRTHSMDYDRTIKMKESIWNNFVKTMSHQ